MKTCRLALIPGEGPAAAAVLAAVAASGQGIGIRPGLSRTDDITAMVIAALWARAVRDRPNAGAA